MKTIIPVLECYYKDRSTGEVKPSFGQLTLAISPKERIIMNDQVMEQTDTVAIISDVKHYAVDIDENGNEVRREIPSFDIPSEAEPTKSV